METVESEVLESGRRDSRGRRYVKAAQREQLLEAYDCSGLTQKQFCEREGINLHTLVSWLGKRRSGSVKDPQHGIFRELLMAPALGPGSVSIEVQLPGGEIVRGSSAAEVAHVVRLLRR
jgi:hypothetical protein